MDSEPKSVVENAKEMQSRQIANGELVITPFATFKFSYLSSEIFQQSLVRDQILQMNIPKITIDNAKQVIEDLRIKKPITIISLVKREKEQADPIASLKGSVSSSSEVILYFDPQNPRVVESLRKWRGRQVAHELNHIARYQAGKMEDKKHFLLDHLISEGLATHYEEYWGDKFEPTPWGSALTYQQEKEEWKKARQQGNSPMWTFSQWFFGEGHPSLTGYHLGTAIVRAYFQSHPGARMKDVVTMSSRDILKKSSYEGNM